MEDGNVAPTKKSTSSKATPKQSRDSIAYDDCWHVGSHGGLHVEESESWGP